MVPFLSRLRVAFFEMRERAVSILAVEVTGFSALLLYLFLLPEQEIVIILALIAFTGLVSGTVASNNTAKVYAGISARSPQWNAPQMTLWLFMFEQVLSLIVALLVISRGFDSLGTVPIWNLLALAALSSSASVTAFARNTEVDFLRYNYLRAGSNMLRVGSVFWATAAGRPDLIGLIFLVTLSLPFLFGVGIVFRHLDIAPRGAGTSLLALLREYVFGLPAAASRAFVVNGLVLAAVETLNESEARFLRLLLMPKDILARCFNAALPLVFDRMFTYRPTLPVMATVLFSSLICGAVSYFAVAAVASSGFAAMPAYLILFAATLQVYLFLPFIWRVVHGNRAIVSTGTVVLAAGITYVAFRTYPPLDAGGFIGVIAIYYVVWLSIITMLLRRERKFEDT